MLPLCCLQYAAVRRFKAVVMASGPTAVFHTQSVILAILGLFFPLAVSGMPEVISKKRKSHPTLMLQSILKTLTYWKQLATVASSVVC